MNNHAFFSPEITIYLLNAASTGMFGNFETCYHICTSKIKKFKKKIRLSSHPVSLWISDKGLRPYISLLIIIL